MDKLWDPLVFDRVLENWSDHPFTDIKVLDFNGEEYNDYWAGNYENQ
jgi:hypothetical protein